jgi:hypothetical protein
MKTFFKTVIVMLTTFALMVSCTVYDDSALLKRIEELERRLNALENLAEQLDAAQKAGLHVTSYTVLPGGAGWKITFSDGSVIEVRNGTNGKDGTDGEDGEDGEDGAPGKDGKNGVDGKDGEDGTDGKDGAPGKDGKNGVDGKDGEDGTDGKDGAPGKDGKNGVDGKDGQDGKDGADGNDSPVKDIYEDGTNLVIELIDGRRYSFPMTTVASGTVGSIEWAFYESGTFRVSGTGDMPDCEYFDKQPWYMWSGDIKRVVIADGVTSIGKYAFMYCDDITKVTIPASVTRIGDLAFYGCTDLTALTLPEGVVTIENRAFGMCTSLTEVTLPASAKYVYSSAFSYCFSLTAINVASGSDYISKDGVLFKGDALFTYPAGKKATGYTIPSDLAVVIAEYAFAGCQYLTEITIPENVKSVGIHSFHNCPELATVTCLRPEPPTLADEFNFNMNKADVLRVPAASVAAYKANAKWNAAFEGGIVAIP